MITLALLALAVGVLTASLLVAMPVPWGGEVPLGFALAIALPAMLSLGRLAVVDMAGVAIAAALQRPMPDRLAVLSSTGRRALAVFAAGLAAAGARAAGVDGPALVAMAAAAGVLTAEFGWAALNGAGAPARFRSALAVYLTLVCAAVLFAVAVDRVGVALASVAALPLVVTRFAYRRYSDAADTLEQTVQALGLVPELAGLAPLGHSERAAQYAGAIAGVLGFDRPGIGRIVTATRLHHLGAVRADDERDTPTSPAEIAAAGARMLRESGFPSDVADLLQIARADGSGGDSPTLAAAAVRVATTFDHAVGDDPSGINRGLSLVSAVAIDANGRRAAAALFSLVGTRPSLVADAIAAGDRFRAAAQGLDLDALVAEQGNADLLPFTSRRS